MSYNIAIDGYSACGKSTLAKALASRLNFKYVDTGAMYRAVTLYLLKNNVNYKSHLALENSLKEINIEFKIIDGANTTFLNNKSVESEIRSLTVSNQVSHIAAISAVRKKLVAIQKEIGKNNDVVMDGRDIGSVVFKDALVKVFLTSSIETRTKRRALEATDQDIEDIRKNLITRDKIDSSREDSPLIQTEDAVLIDNTNLTREEQLEILLTLVKIRIKNS